MKILYGTKDISDYLLSYESIVEFENNRLIGNTPSVKVDIEIDNYENVFNGDYNQPVYVYDGERKLGTYHICDTPESTDKKLKLTMYDNMMLFNKPYLTKMTYPCTVNDQIVEMEKLAGVKIDYHALPSSLLAKEINWYDNTISMRLFIGWIAESAGMNAFVDENGMVFFRPLSKEIACDIPLNDLEDFIVCNDVYISRVEFNNGLLLFERGENTEDTLYISSDNPYMDDQAMIDHIYDLYQGMTFTSVKSVRIIESPALKLGDVFAYDNQKWIAMSIKTIYHGGSYAIQEINGEFNSSEYQALSRQIGDSTKIRMLTIEVNRNSNEVKIVAKEQEGLNMAYAQLVLDTNTIKQDVKKANESLYLMETGRGNIFDNCDQYIRKYENDIEIEYIADMPLGINMQELRNRDICMSVDIKTVKAIARTLSSRVGCKFTITYQDDTVDTFEIWFYIGVYSLKVIRGNYLVDYDKRVWKVFHVKDKEIKYVSNLGIYAEVNGEYVSVGRPKVEFGTYPTGFAFDMQAIRDSITTVENYYTEIEQKTNTLTLKAVENEQEITNIKGEISTVDKRLQSAEIKLTSTEIVNAVNEKISKDGAVTTSSTTLDKNGFHIKGKGFDVTNLKNKKVFELDSDGNIVVSDITAKNGNFEGVITNKNGTATAQLFQGALTFSDSRYGNMVLGNNGISFSSQGKTNFAITNGANSSETVLETNEDNPMILSWRSGTSKVNVMRVAKSVGLGVLVYGGTYFTVQNGQSFSGDVRAAAYGGLLMESASDISFYPSGGTAAGRPAALVLESDNVSIYKDAYVWANFVVTGNKNKAMPTSHGYVGMEAVESPVPMFEDYGTGITNDEGKVSIYFDPVWLEVTSPDHEYFVYLQECGDGKVWVSERTGTYFVVTGTPNIEFMWNVKARQKGFEIEKYRKVEVPNQDLKAMNVHEKAMSQINDRNSAKAASYESAYENILKERISVI